MNGERSRADSPLCGWWLRVCSHMIATQVTPKTGIKKQQADLVNSVSIRGESANSPSALQAKPVHVLTNLVGQFHSASGQGLRLWVNPIVTNTSVMIKDCIHIGKIVILTALSIKLSHHLYEERITIQMFWPLNRLLVQFDVSVSFL